MLPTFSSRAKPMMIFRIPNIARHPARHGPSICIPSTKKAPEPPVVLKPGIYAAISLTVIVVMENMGDTSISQMSSNVPENFVISFATKLSTVAPIPPAYAKTDAAKNAVKVAEIT